RLRLCPRRHLLTARQRRRRVQSPQPQRAGLDFPRSRRTAGTPDEEAGAGDRPVAFTNLRDATREDWDRIDALDEARTDHAEAPLALLESLNGGAPAGYTLTPYAHSRQAATRALRAGESSQFIVSVLFHDAADRLAPANHGQIAAELLRPFVDDDHYWMVKMHGLFQKENF